MNDREFIAVFHYDNGGTNRCGAEPYRYAEEIVRCKECKYWEIPRHHNYGDGMKHIAPWCRKLCTSRFKADDFCSYGERREP